MSKRSQRRRSSKLQSSNRKADALPLADFEGAYQRACALAAQGERRPAGSAYSALSLENLPPRLHALVENDLGALAVVAGKLAEARQHFEQALQLNADCAAARKNLALITVPPRIDSPPSVIQNDDARVVPSVPAADHVRPTRVAILSLLFNWPSTGGGTIHTAELGKFLGKAGYAVRHIYAQNAEWRIGNVTADTGVPSTPLAFDQASWNVGEIQRRFRQAVDEFAPDYVIVTDSWNFKPLLAEAVHGYRYFLRLAALECLCPLNNVRLILDHDGGAVGCPRHQLASPHLCGDCVMRRQHQSGSLHQAERGLAGYGTAEYDQKLRQAFAEAEGVLVVNPLIATMVEPFSSKVHVVPSGFDPERFPWPWPDEGQLPRRPTTLFFAGLVDEYMKGFGVLEAACRKLWAKRRDFQLVATGDPAGHLNPFTRFIGWQSQADLPRQLHQADFLVFPTIAEEALGRSAVEAMGVGRPVIASRIGGLPFTVADGATGLLFESGNVDDLAAKIETLLDDRPLRERMGRAARKRFEEHFTWEKIIEKHYRRLLAPIATRT